MKFATAAQGDEQRHPLAYVSAGKCVGQDDFVPCGLVGLAVGVTGSVVAEPPVQPPSGARNQPDRDPIITPMTSPQLKMGLSRI